MNVSVFVVDSVDDILMTAGFKQCHFDIMMSRGWITTNGWIVPGQTVYTIKHDMVIEFFKEAAI